MPDDRFPVEVVRGVPLVRAPEEIDITNAAGLRAALLESAAHGPGTFVVDMTRTQFCDIAPTSPAWKKLSATRPLQPSHRVPARLTDRPGGLAPVQVPTPLPVREKDLKMIPNEQWCHGLSRRRAALR